MIKIFKFWQYLFLKEKTTQICIGDNNIQQISNSKNININGKEIKNNDKN